MELAVNTSAAIRTEAEVMSYLLERNHTWYATYKSLLGGERDEARTDLIRTINASRALSTPPIELYESIDEILGTSEYGEEPTEIEKKFERLSKTPDEKPIIETAQYKCATCGGEKKTSWSKTCTPCRIKRKFVLTPEALRAAIDDSNPLQTVGEVAANLGVSSATIYNRIKESPELEAIWRIRSDNFNQYLEEKEGPKKNGRPAFAFDLAKVERLASLHRTNLDLADALGTSRSTFNRNLQDSTEFQEAVERGRASAKNNKNITKAITEPESNIPASNIPESKEMPIEEVAKPAPVRGVAQESFQYIVTIGREQQRHLIALAHWGNCSVEEIITEAIKFHLEQDREWQASERFGEITDALKEVIKESGWYETYHKFGIGRDDLLKYLMDQIAQSLPSRTIADMRHDLGIQIAKNISAQITKRNV